MSVLQTIGIGVTLAAAALGQTAFEVASVKPALNSNQKIPVLRDDPGRLDWANVPLNQVIAKAYRLKDYQVTGPDWLASARFDIQAKLPVGAAESQKWPMLQNLLAERFHLTVHRDEKALDVYALEVVKTGPNLKEHVDTSDPGKLVMNFGRLQADDQTMTGFVDVLSRMMDRPVVDRTGLTGTYDISLHWSPEANDGSIVGMKLGAERAAGGEMKLPPASGPGIFVAVQQQLGLKLGPRKLPVEILVVDRAEKVPLEN